MSLTPAFDIPYQAGRFPPAYDYASALSPDDNTRRFTKFVTAQSTYVEAPKIEAVGDYEFKADIVMPEVVNANQAIIGGDAGAGAGQFAMFIAPSGAVVVQYPISTGVTYAVSAYDVTAKQYAGSMLSVGLKRQGNTVTISLNDQTRSITRADFEPIEVVDIGGWNTALIFNDVISDVNFVSGFTQIGNPTGNPYYKLDENLSDNVRINSNGGLASGTSINMTVANAELYTKTTGFIDNWISNSYSFDVYKEKFFMSLERAVSKRIELNSSVSIDQPFYASADVTVSSIAGMILFSGQSFGDRLYLGAENYQILVGNGVNRVNVNTANLNDGDLHRIELIIDNNVFQVKLDNDIVYNEPVAYTGQKLISKIGIDGQNNGGWSGIVSNAKLESNGITYVDSGLSTAAMTNELNNDGTLTLTTTNVFIDDCQLHNETNTGWISYDGIPLNRAY